MNDPRIPALLVSHRRPGFYFRVLEEGEVQAGDEIVKLASGPEQMTVAEVDALLYLPGHPRQQLLRALRIPALSPGWQASFRALLDGEPGSGNAGLAATSPPPAWPGFRRLTVTAIDARERLRDLDPPRGPRRRAAPAPRARASTSRCASSPTTQQRSVLRNYSLSGPPGAGYYRITVKREPDGAASGYLHTRLARRRPARRRARRAARSSSTETDAPVLLISAGIGATPVLAMLHALAQEHSEREIWWLHGARSGRDHAFAAEARDAPRLAPERAHPRLLQPSRPGRPRGPRLRRRGPSHRVAARRARAAARRRGLPLRAGAVHGRDQRRPGRDRPRRRRASTPSRSGPRRA